MEQVRAHLGWYIGTIFGAIGDSKGTPKGPQMIQNGHFGAISGSGGSELVEQCGKRVEQVRAHWGDALEPFLGSGGPFRGPKRIQKGSKWP